MLCRLSISVLCLVSFNSPHYLGQIAPSLWSPDTCWYSPRRRVSGIITQGRGITQHTVSFLLGVPARRAIRNRFSLPKASKLTHPKISSQQTQWKTSSWRCSTSYLVLSSPVMHWMSHCVIFLPQREDPVQWLVQCLLDCVVGAVKGGRSVTPHCAVYERRYAFIVD